MSNRIDFHLRRSLLLCLLLASLVWGVVPLLRAEVPAGTRSGSLAGSENHAETAVLQTSSSVDGASLSAATASAKVLPRYNTAGDVLYEPTSLAIDSSGDVWVASYIGGVTEFSPIGVVMSPTTGYASSILNESYGLTIDVNNNVWVTSEETPSPNYNSGYGNITELDSSGNVISPTGGYYGGGIYFPGAIASDTLGRIWVADGKNMASLLSNSGAAISSSSGYAVGELAFPDGIAVDANNDAWFANSSSNYITHVAPDGTVLNQVTGSSYSTSGLAVDQSGNVWVGNWHNNTISEISGTTNVVVSTTSGGGIDHPYGVAIDGRGNVWTANYLGNSITELQGSNGSSPGSALSPTKGLGTAAGLIEPMGLAIDASGNVWVTSYGTNTLTMFVGAAAPVQTPLVGPAKLP